MRWHGLFFCSLRHNSLYLIRVVLSDTEEDVMFREVYYDGEKFWYDCEDCGDRMETRFLPVWIDGKLLCVTCKIVYVRGAPKRSKKIRKH